LTINGASLGRIRTCGLAITRSHYRTVLVMAGHPA
jgi:hypothetical protein